MRRLRFLERSELSCCGIPMSQAMVLQALATNDRGHSMSAIAETLGVAQSTATRLVEPLVKQKQIVRTRAAEDGRSVLITLTDKGRDSARELARLSQRWSDGVLRRIPADQYENVIDALETVLAAVSSCCANGCEPVPGGRGREQGSDTPLQSQKEIKRHEHDDKEQ
jgi:DNA-binding MarR family transcriptional regulator